MQICESFHIFGGDIAQLPNTQETNVKRNKNAPNKRKTEAIAGVAQWIEHRSVNQRVTSLIPSQGAYLHWRPGPQLQAHERQPHIDVSLPLFLLPFPSL